MRKDFLFVVISSDDHQTQGSQCSPIALELTCSSSIAHEFIKENLYNPGDHVWFSTKVLNGLGTKVDVDVHLVICNPNTHRPQQMKLHAGVTNQGECAKD
jgi:hypothetical protein